MFQRVLPFLRRFSMQNPSLKENIKMKSWQIHEYGDLGNLQLGEARVPVINDPHQVLVKVKAASVNPIDLAMISKGFPDVLFCFV